MEKNKMNTAELRTTTSIRAKFAKDRHTEKVDLTKLRFNLAMKMLERRDKFAKDRHSERKELIE